MFWLIKKIIIVLLSFGESLAYVAKVSNCGKFISLNNQPCMARAMLINLNPFE